MNNSAMLLQQLKDIHLPPQPGFWPLAAGWYWLISLLLIFLGIAGFYRYRHLRRQRYRRLALKQLQQLITMVDTANLVANLSILLRRTAIAAYPRHQVAGLTGQDWLEFLDKTGNTAEFTSTMGQMLLTAPYQLNPSTEQVKVLLKLVENWILSHR